MKEKKHSLIIFSILICSLLLFASCDKLKGGFTKSKDPGVSISGNGLTLEFMRGFPADQMYAESDSKIPILVEVTNKGDYNIKESDMCFVNIGGFDTQIIEITDTSNFKVNCNELTGKEYAEFKTMEFEGIIKKDKIKESYTPTIIANLCYAYQTQAYSQFCVSPNLYDSEIVSSHACKPSTSVSFPTQRAPIVVSNADIRSAGNKVYLTLHISNRGGGLAIDKSNIDVCPNNLKREHIDNVDYEIRVASAKSISCTPDFKSDKKIKLINGNGRAVCTLEFDSGNSFETPIEVELNYGYAQSTSKKIKIVNPDNIFN